MAALTLAGAPLQAGDNTFTVNSTLDDGSPGTLRWAIGQANAAGAGTQTINFSLAAGSTITLSSALPMLDNSAGTVAIAGPGAGALTVDGNQAGRVFFVASGTVAISELTVENGAAHGGTGGSGAGGGGGGLGAGGALFVNSGANVTINNMQFASNSATGGTGGAQIDGRAGGGGGGFGGNGGLGNNGGGGGGGFAGAGGGNNISNGGGGGGGLAGDGGSASGGGGGGGGTTAGETTGTGTGGNGNTGAQGGSQGGVVPPGFGISGGAGQSSLTGGGGGGGEGGGGSPIYPAGSGGAGGNGGTTGGGGGGGAAGLSSSFPSPGGTGGNGGTYGGGGGGGLSFSSQAVGGHGGDFGGGGGGGMTIDFSGGGSNPGGSGGAAGFGGGGGGGGTNGWQSTSAPGGAGGFGAGKGGNAGSAGDGGSGYGGAVFVREGGTLTVVGTTVSSSAVTAGTSGGTGGSGGSAAGQDLYLMSGVTAVFKDAGSMFNGSISGDGGVTIQGQGTTALLGANDYTGGTLVKDGARLQGTTSSLQGTIHNNASVLFDQSTDGTFVGTMTGTGSVVKTGAGSVSFSGTNDYSGTTEIQQGRLAINGSIASDTTVDAGAILGGNGVITGAVTNHGTLAAGNSIDTLTINGSYSDTAGSTTQVEINAGGSTPGVNNDLTVVNGTATLNGGTVNVLAAPGSYTAGTRYVFLEATTLSGTYSSITGFNQPGLRAVLGYGDILIGSTEYLTAYFTLLQAQSDFASIATTPNQYGVATYIDTNSIGASPELQAVIDTLNTLSVPEQQAALDAMTAQVNGTMAQLNVQDMTFLYAVLRRRVGSAFAAGGLAGNSTGGGFLAGGNTSAAGATITPVSLKSGSSAPGYVTPTANCQSCPSWGGWMAGFGFGGNGSSDGNAAGGVFNSGGTMAAIERPLDENNLLGFFGAYANLGLRLTGLPQSSSANQGNFGTYYLRDMGRTYFLAAGSAGFTGYRESRTMTFGNINSTATGTYSGWNPSVYVEDGLRWQVGRTTLQPYAALQYIYVRQNSFTETGAGVLDQTVAGIDTHALRGLLGSRVSQVWQTSAGTAFVPELRAAWLHEFLAPNSTLNAVFAPVGGASFAAQGLNFGRDWAWLGAGTQYVMNQNVSLFANYDLLFNVREAWNAGSGGVQVTW